MIHGKRIGLVGFSCASGLGELNRQIAANCPIDLWLVKPHRLWGVGDHLPNTRTLVASNTDHVDEFLQEVDVVLFCETPFYPNLVKRAKQSDKRVVCVPMVEWLPQDPSEWLDQVDLCICPTFQCFSYVRQPSAYFPWPADTKRFQFQHRRVCQRFLFLNGNGGWGGRKGADCVKRAKELWPEMPLVVRSQAPIIWPAGTEVLSAEVDNSLIYDDGDILLVPHSTDGIGLEQLESMSCGMPIVSTYGEPWNEFPAIEKIRSTIQIQTVRPVDWYVPCPESLVECCKSLLGKDIAKESREVREWAEARDWSKHVDDFMNLVTGNL